MSSICDLANESFMKKKSKCASFAQQNGFGPAVLRSLLRLVKGAPKAPDVDSRRKKCAKKKACGKALVDMAKGHCYQSREL
jgi:hypothetical protein